ncbi:MAG TPA: peptide ABC transporter substrate-binding protein [Bdellovibrionota bacterium]|nr:peptide ABC transporter substrate-binding protein [Bdellovibrionota bacterium]
MVLKKLLRGILVSMLLYGQYGYCETTPAAEPGSMNASVLRFRLPSDPITLDWTLAHTSAETHVIMNIMEGLTEEGPDLQPRAALAEKWDISPDGKTYTFHLRQGIKWSDGKPLIAEHFRNSWLRLLDPKTKSSYADFLFDIQNADAFHNGKITNSASVGIKALSDTRLEVTLRRIVPYFLHLPSFWVTFPIRMDLIQKHGPAWALPKNIVTLGAYQLDDWKRGKLLTLKRNPGYFANGTESAPAIERIEVLVEADDKKARELFKNGQLDFLLDATTDDFINARSAVEANHVMAAQFPYLATYYLGFNVKSGPLRDAAVRRALSAAIDRESIASALQGGQVAAKGWIPPGMAGYRSEPLMRDSLYDARGNLAKAGYVEGQGFPKLDIWVQKFDGAEILADFLVKSMRGKLGIDLRAHVVVPSKYQKILASGKAALFVGHWGADFPDPANFFEVFASESGSNRTGWSNPEYDRQLKLARGTLEMSERLAAYARAEKILLQDEAVINPLFFKHHTVLVGRRLKEIKISPLNYLFLKILRLTN